MTSRKLLLRHLALQINFVRLVNLKYHLTEVEKKI
jgi:hypothetical protein